MLYFAGAMQSSNEKIYSISYGVEESGDYYGARRNPEMRLKFIEVILKQMDIPFIILLQRIYMKVGLSRILANLIREQEIGTRLQRYARKPIFTPPYKHFVEDDLVLKASYPIINEQGVLQGVLGTTYHLDKSQSIFKGNRN